jgi:hypothetical protein
MKQHSWGSMLRTVRAAFAMMVVCWIGLALPPQMSDMLALSGWVTASFEIALVVLGGSVWFWSHAALAARFGTGDGQRGGAATPGFNWVAFRWLPRIMAAGSFLPGVVIAGRSNSWLHAVAAIVLSVSMTIFVIILTMFRPPGPPVVGPPARRYRFRAWLHGGAKARLKALLQWAPYGAVPAWVLLALGLVPLALGTIESFSYSLRLPNRLAAVFPGPSIAVLLLGLMIGPLVAVTFVFDGLTLQWRFESQPWGFLRLQWRVPERRLPVLSAILLYVFVVVPAWFHIHTVRLIDGATVARKPLDELFDQWVKTCAPDKGPVQPIIVAVSGGATRAGLWGAAVMDRVLQAQQPNGPALFAVSSVSGGSLGTAGAMSLLSLENPPCRAAGLPLLRPATDGKSAPLAGDALGPLLGGWLLDDIPRSAFEPIAALIQSATGHRPNGGDRAEAIEHGFEDLWSLALQKSPLKGAPDWNQPFLSLFYTDRAATYRNGMPLWFANGTDATTGNRVITSPIAAPHRPESRFPWPFRGARDFHTLMGGDVSISTAINNTARFPYLEPFGEMLPLKGDKQVGSLVDGGYFENEGLQTALDIAEWLVAQSETLGRPVQPIIVQATGDGEADVGPRDVMTCANASDGAFIPDDKHGVWQIFAPLIGLYHVRGGHSAVLLRQAHDQFCRPRPRFVHFYLPSDEEGRPIPLNWVLSNATAESIWRAFTDRQVANATELQRLKAALAPEGP